MDKKIIRTLGKGAAISVVGIVLGRLFHFLGFVVVARSIGPSEFGVYALIWNIISISAVICTVGLDRGVIHYLNNTTYDDKKNIVIKKSFLISIIASIIFIALFAINYLLDITSILNYTDFNLYLLVFSFLIALISMLYIGTAVTRVTLNMKYTFYYQYLGQPLIFFIFVLLFSFFGLHLLNSIISLYISFVIVLIFTIRSIVKLFPVRNFLVKSRNIKIKGLLNYSLLTLFASSITLLTTRFDRILLGILKNEFDVGIYQAVSQITILMALMLGGLGSIIIPMISKYFNENDFQQIQTLLQVSTKWSFYLSIPVFILLTTIPEDIILIVFGKDYIIGSVALQILALAQLINAGTGPIGPALIMTKNQKPWMIIAVFSFILNISLNFLLIPEYSYVGNSISLIFTMIVLYGSGLLLLKRKLNIQPYNTNFIKGIVAGIISFIVLKIVTSIHFNYLPIKVLIFIILAYTVFLGTLYLLQLDKEDKVIYDLIKVKFGKTL